MKKNLPIYRSPSSMNPIVYVFVDIQITQNCAHRTINSQRVPCMCLCTVCKWFHFLNENFSMEFCLQKGTNPVDYACVQSIVISAMNIFIATQFHRSSDKFVGRCVRCTNITISHLQQTPKLSLSFSLPRWFITIARSKLCLFASMNLNFTLGRVVRLQNLHLYVIFILLLLLLSVFTECNWWPLDHSNERNCD